MEKRGEKKENKQWEDISKIKQNEKKRENWGVGTKKEGKKHTAKMKEKRKEKKKWG
jgi:hypothetical protein